MKKLLLGLVILSLVLSVFVGFNSISFAQKKYSEAPMLAELVKAGKLPPVEERLPEEPWVIKPEEEIGQYGGELRTGTTSAATILETGMPAFLFFPDRTGTKIEAHLGKALVPSRDFKKYTIYLRKGLKWSDGHPFTVDDILFWWNDVILNNELTPIKPLLWMPAGKLAKFRKIDDYTLEISFAVSYRPMMWYLAGWGTMSNYAYHPAHYLKKWHKKYNSDADKIARQEGFDSWWKAFSWHSSTSNDPDLPTLNPYKLVKKTTTQIIYERNPYFGAVDTTGNQLPYIDRYVGEIVSNTEVLVMKLLSGEYDIAGKLIDLTNYTLLKENEKKGGYKVLLWDSALSSECVFAFNQNHKDPILRKIFQDKRFRQAMSLAINREEINQFVFLGLGKPVQATVLPSCTYFKEKWATSYAEYDPKKANQLLDSIGLDWDKEHKYRLRPDGKTLEITLQIPTGGTGLSAFYPVCELVKKHWETVGVKVNLTTIDRTLYTQRALAGMLDVGMWNADRVSEGRAYLPGWTKWDITQEGKQAFGWAVDWGLWYETGGKKGEEPSPEVKAFFSAMDQWHLAVTDKKYLEYAQKVWDLQAENLFLIGTVGRCKVPIVVKDYIRNVPKNILWSDDFRFWYSARMEQFFIKK
jgi:peptide/nickel transport system substrate-binding protein